MFAVRCAFEATQQWYVLSLTTGYGPTLPMNILYSGHWPQQKINSFLSVLTFKYMGESHRVLDLRGSVATRRQYYELSYNVNRDISLSRGSILALMGASQGGRCKNAVAFIVDEAASLLADNITCSHHIIMTTETTRRQLRHNYNRDNYPYHYEKDNYCRGYP